MCLPYWASLKPWHSDKTAVILIRDSPFLLFFRCSSSIPGTPGIPRNVLWVFPYQTRSSWSGGIVWGRKGKGQIIYMWFQSAAVSLSFNLNNRFSCCPAGGAVLKDIHTFWWSPTKSHKATRGPEQKHIISSSSPPPPCRRCCCRSAPPPGSAPARSGRTLYKSSSCVGPPGWRRWSSALCRLHWTPEGHKNSVNITKGSHETTLHITCWNQKLKLSSPPTWGCYSWAGPRVPGTGLCLWTGPSRCLLWSKSWRRCPDPLRGWSSGRWSLRWAAPGWTASAPLHRENKKCEHAKWKFKIDF